MLDEKVAPAQNCCHQPDRNSCIIVASMRTFLQRRFTLFALIAALCLLGMQQAATAHSFAHLTNEHSSQPQGNLPHTQNCDLCFVYADISGAGPTTDNGEFHAPVASVVITSALPTARACVTQPVYSARAPPLSF